MTRVDSARTQSIWFSAMGAVDPEEGDAAIGEYPGEIADEDSTARIRAG